METPSRQLAARILARLADEMLLVATDQTKLIDKLAEGKLKPEDWRIAIELAGDQEKKE